MRHKPLTIFSLVAVILFFAAMPAQAVTTARDVIGSRYETAIRFLYEHEVVHGYPDGTFQPNSQVNRAEFLLMVLRSSGVQPTGINKNCFNDVHDEWFAQSICYAKSRGWITGYPDNFFRPGQSVNKVEVFTILARVRGFADVVAESLPYTDLPNSDWYFPALRVAHNKGLIEEQSAKFRPSELVTRGRTSDVLYRAMKLPVVQGTTPAPVQSPQSNPSPLPPPTSTAARQKLTQSDFSYLGAFRLPKEGSGGSRFGYGGGALALNPHGDPNGAADGYPGSLYILGHEHDQLVAEVNIPAPKKQNGQNSESVAGLPSADYLHGFVDVTGGMAQTFDEGNGYRVDGLAYLDAQGSQDSGKLYWTARTYYNVEGSDDLSHGMSDANLSNLNAKGLWRLGNFHGQTTGGYIFPVPSYFADAYLGGKRLISGLFTQQGVAHTSQGPAFFAFAPWLNYSGTTPPASGTALAAQKLVSYPYRGQAATDNDPPSNFPDYQVPDSWDAAAWVDTPEKHAVVVVGHRAMGATYYGDARPNDCTIYKGYHGEPYEPRILFYDPAELAQASQGTKDPNTIVPYLEWNPSAYMVNTCMWQLTGVVYDEVNQLLYVLHAEADTEDGEPTPLVYVFRIM